MEQLAPQVLLPHGLPSIPLPPEHPPASRASPCLQHLPLQPICSVPRGISGRVTRHGLHPLLQMPHASLKSLSRTPETYISAPHLWPITSPPPLGVPRLHGCRIPWKAFNSHCGPGLLKAGPHIRISGYQKPMPTGTPDPIRGPASAGPGHGPGIRILSAGGLFREVLALPLWLVALRIPQSRLSPRDCVSFSSLCLSPAPSPLSEGMIPYVSSSRKAAVCFCSSGPHWSTVSLCPR